MVYRRGYKPAMAIGQVYRPAMAVGQAMRGFHLKGYTGDRCVQPGPARRRPAGGGRRSHGPVQLSTVQLVEGADQMMMMS